MDFDPKDTAVVALLAKLKSAEVEYPPELFASRRQRFVQQAAAMGLAAGISPIPKITSTTSAGGSAAVTWSGALEAILTIAIVIEAGAAAYFYRDQIAEFIRSYNPGISATVSITPSDNESSLPKPTGTELPTTAVTPQASPTNTPTMTATVTATPTVIVENNEANDQIVSTPDLKGNNGNHYGQTPKPERTKDNNGNGDDKDKDR